MSTAGCDPARNGPFKAIADLEAEHRAMHRSTSGRILDATDIERARRFVARAIATGTVLDRDEERWTAQNVVDYWAAILVANGDSLFEAGLCPFDTAQAPELDAGDCPYLGLSPFEKGDHLRFFGRTALVKDLMYRVAHHQLVAVVGPSGSGKSSLLRAGLIARLEVVPSGERFDRLLLLTPGTNPILELARVVIECGAATGSLTSVAEKLSADPASLARWFASAGPCMLVVDQFEELFTLCDDKQQQQSFAEASRALLASGPAHRLVFAMRDTEFSRLQLLPAIHVQESNTLRVTPLSASELRAAIEEPAARAGLRFETGIVEQLVGEVLGEPAGLPLLQFALLELWEQRQKNRVTWQAYNNVRKFGGVRQALGHRADRVYESMSEDDQRTCAQLLLTLIHRSPIELERRRVTRNTMLRETNASNLGPLVDRLVEARLLRVERRGDPADDTIEIAHDALIRYWPRLQGWIGDQRHRLLERARFKDAAERWAAGGRRQEDLPRNPEHLSREKDNQGLSAIEVEYLHASEKLLLAEQSAAMRSRIRRYVAGTLAVAAVLGFLWVEHTKSVERSWAATVRGLAAKAEVGGIAYDRLLLAASEANRRRNEDPTRDLLLRTLQAHPKVRRVHRDHKNTVTALAFHPTEDVLLTSGADGRIMAYSSTAPGQGRELARLGNEVNCLVFDALGSQLAAGCGDSSIELWDWKNESASNQRRRQLPAPDPTNSAEVGRRGVLSLAFRGEELVAGMSDGRVAFWGAGSEPHVERKRAHDNSLVWDLSIAPDGRVASVDEDGRIVLWREREPAVVRDVTRGDGLLAVTFSPDGRFLLTAGLKGEVVVWGFDPSPERTKSLVSLGHKSAAHPRLVYDLALRAGSDGTWLLASAGKEGTVFLWDVNVKADASPPVQIQLHRLAGEGSGLTCNTDRVYRVAFDPCRSDRLATGAGDGAVILWDLAATPRPGQLVSKDARSAEAVAFAPAGWPLAIANEHGKVDLLERDGRIRSLRDGGSGPERGIWALAFAPRQPWLAAVGGQGAVEVYDLEARTSETLSGHDNTMNVLAVCFGGDGSLLATAGEDSLRLWRHDSKRWIADDVPGSRRQGEVAGVTFSNDGQVLASCGGDGRVILRWLADGSSRERVLYPFGAWDLAFHPRGSMLAVALADGSIALIDPRDSGLRDLASPLQGHLGQQKVRLAFSSDGSLLASAGQDGNVFLWTMSNGSKLGRSLIQGDARPPVWDVAFGAGDELVTCHADGSIVLWTTSSVGWRELAREVATRDLEPTDLAELEEPRALLPGGAAPRW